MRLLSTRNLVKDWQSGRLPEAQLVQYLLVSTVAITAGYYLPRESSQFVWINRIEIAVMFAISIWGIYWTFLKNGGAKGHDYIARFISFSVPVGIQLLLASVVVSFGYGLLSGVVLEAKGSADAIVFYLDLGYLGLATVIELGYFGLIGYFLSQLRSAE